MAVGCWLLAVGCWLLAVGCWLLAVGCWLLAGVLTKNAFGIFCVEERGLFLSDKIVVSIIGIIFSYFLSCYKWVLREFCHFLGDFRCKCQPFLGWAEVSFYGIDRENSQSTTQILGEINEIIEKY
jgi:hypothetical protein